MKMQRKSSYLFIFLVVALTVGSGIRAEVATHGTEDITDRPIVVLETNRITEDDGPYGSVWEPESEPSGRTHVLNPEGAANDDGRPSIVLHPVTRMPIVAWSQRSADGYDIVVSRFVNGTWTTPAVVAGGADDQRDAHLTVDRASGAVHLFYRTGGAAARIEHRQAPASGDDWSAPTVVSQAGEIAVRPTAAWHAGRLLVAYEVHLGALDSASRQIVVAQREQDLWVGEFVASASFSEANEPQIHSDGTRVWIDWIDGPDVMRWTCRENDGPWTPLAVEPFAGAEDREYHVRGRVKRTVRQQ